MAIYYDYLTTEAGQILTTEDGVLLAIQAYSDIPYCVALELGAAWNVQIELRPVWNFEIEVTASWLVSGESVQCPA